MMLVNHKAAARLCGCLGLALPSSVSVVFGELPVTADRLQGQNPSLILHFDSGQSSLCSVTKEHGDILQEAHH